MKVLVTGGTGLIGRSTVRALGMRGHAVRVLSRRVAATDGLEVWPGDVSRAESIRGAADGCETVVHVAGIAGEDPPARTFRAVNINGTAPFVGPYLATILRGGAEIGPDTLARFYSIHMLLVPGALIGLIGFHLYLVVRLGVSSPPWSKEAAGGEPDDEPPPARSGLVQPGPRAAGVRRRPAE